MGSPVRFSYEYDRRLRVGYLGCGGHSFRNILPTFRFAPVELVAVCDLDEAKARAFARQFGAERIFTDYERMLAEVDLEAVFIVTGYDQSGVTHTPRAIEALDAGCHVWIEKPPANSVAEVEALIAAEQRTRRSVLVGLKKCFLPAVQKAREIAHSEAFGGITSLTVRYPQHLPPALAERREPAQMRGFLDHIVHPAGVLHHLAGPVESLHFDVAPNGASVTCLRFASGAVGTLHLPAGQSGTSPLERLEVVGHGANVVVDNGVRLTYYRPGARGDGGYGRAPSFIGDDAGAPLVWEPEFSLGQLYNKGLFLLGYAQEVIYFCECVLAGCRPEIAGTDYALATMKLYEAYSNPERTVVSL